jgi:hypothetical protein
MNPNRAAYIVIDTERALLKETAERSHHHRESFAVEARPHIMQRSLGWMRRLIAHSGSNVRGNIDQVAPNAQPDVSASPESLR